MRRLARWIGVAAAVAAALAGLAAWSRREVRRAEADFPPSGRLVELEGGGRLHVVEEGAGPPVVLIHGADGVVQEFTRTVSAELACDHRVLTVDRPGHGWSTLPPGAVPDVALNVAFLREGLRRAGVTRPVVVGHSYGGLTALTWALEWPEEVSALVVVAPVAAFPWPVPAWLLAVANMPVVGRVLTDSLVVPLGRVALGALSRNAFHPGDVPEAYASFARALYLRPAQFRALAAEYASMRADAEALAARCAALAVPVEIVAGDGDRVTRVEHHSRPLAASVPGAALTVVPGASHQLMWTHGDAVVEAVRRAEERAR